MQQLALAKFLHSGTGACVQLHRAYCKQSQTVLLLLMPACSGSDAEAVAGLRRLAEANVGQWEEELRAGSGRSEKEDAVAEG
jgi:hypothetical protein